MHSVDRTLISAVFAIALAGGALAGGLTTAHRMSRAQAAPSGLKDLAQFARVAPKAPGVLPLSQNTVSDIVHRVGPAVVKIVARVPQPGSSHPFLGSFFGNRQASPVQTDIGSGFFFDTRGDILTNDHVIFGARAIQVDVPGYSKPFPARVVGGDYATDLAVIRIRPPKNRAALIFGNAAATPVGTWDIAIGNPYNLSGTVTVGVVGAKGRPLTIGSRRYRNLLQTSAAINPGNSGGPLLNLAGQVIGINTAVQTQANGIGFAIPTTTVAQILPSLMRQGYVERAWLGVAIADDSPALARADHLGTGRGVAVLDVVANSPAARSGLQPGDVITRVGGHPVATAVQLQRRVESHPVGATLELTIIRQNRTLRQAVILGQEPNGPIPTPAPSIPFGG